MTDIPDTTIKSVRAHLVAGGQYHDIDYARLELLTLIGAYSHVRTSVSDDYDFAARLSDLDCLITYTCNVIPGPERVCELAQFLEKGGRWLALHGTNSILSQNDAGRWFAPEDKSGFMQLLGSQFAAHPPIAPYDVRITRNDDPLTEGIDDFTVEGGDELYYMRIFGDVDILMDAAPQGPARGFVERKWPEAARHPVLYRKKIGEGEIVYFTLGHRRGHYDMKPLVDYYPAVEKGAWEIAPYRTILRRGLDWAVGAKV